MPGGGARAQASEPDFNLAYVLATASYCAYAVGAVDGNGEKLADQGRKRAFDCLTAAVEADPGHLSALKVEAADIEAYFSPANSHFSVFSSVQEMTWAGGRVQPGPGGGGEEAAKKSFFFSGVANAQGEILWGYGQWCSLLYPPEVKTGPHLTATQF